MKNGNGPRIIRVELWKCEECGAERTYGARDHSLDVITQRPLLEGGVYREGAVLRCETCKGLRRHRWTGKLRTTPRLNFAFGAPISAS